VGMALVLRSLWNMAKSRAGANRRAALGALLFLPTVLCDQVGQFHPLPPPTPIRIAEWTVLVLSLAAAAVGLWPRRADSAS
jgi:hypothetical protein